MKTDIFQSCCHCWVFQICWHIECSIFTASSFRICNSSTGIPSPPLALFVVMLSKAHLTSAARRPNQSILKEISPGFIGGAGIGTEAPIPWPPHVKSWLIGKDPHAGKDWGQEEKGTTEDEMVGWHYQLNDVNLSKLWEMVMDREAWQAAVHGVKKGWTQPTDLTTTLIRTPTWASFSWSFRPGHWLLLGQPSLHTCPCLSWVFCSYNSTAWMESMMLTLSLLHGLDLHPHLSSGQLHTKLLPFGHVCVMYRPWES